MCSFVCLFYLNVRVKNAAEKNVKRKKSEEESEQERKTATDSISRLNPESKVATTNLYIYNQ